MPKIILEPEPFKMIGGPKFVVIDEQNYYSLLRLLRDAAAEDDHIKDRLEKLTETISVMQLELDI